MSFLLLRDPLSISLWIDFARAQNLGPRDILPNKIHHDLDWKSDVACDESLVVEATVAFG